MQKFENFVTEHFSSYLYDCIKNQKTNTSNASLRCFLSLLKELGEKTLVNWVPTSFARTRLLCKTRPVRQSLTLIAALALTNSLSLSFHPFPSTETISGVRRVLARFSIKNLTEKSSKRKNAKSGKAQSVRVNVLLGLHQVRNCFISYIFFAEVPYILTNCVPQFATIMYKLKMKKTCIKICMLCAMWIFNTKIYFHKRIDSCVWKLLMETKRC